MLIAFTKGHHTVASFIYTFAQMKFSAFQIAEMLGGRVDGDPEISVSRLSKIEEGAPGSLSFLANGKYEPFIYSTDASVVIVNDDFRPENALPNGLTLIRVGDAYAAFATLLEQYQKAKRPAPGIAPTAFVDGSATLANGVYLGHHAVVSAGAMIASDTVIESGCYIGKNVRIGASCYIHPGVKILDDCIIGNACTLHSGTVIGSDGFGFAPDAANNYRKVPQTGNVIIEDHVEVGANTTIDRATLGSTVIRKGVKLDNLIQIAHNVEIGENTVIAAQTGVAGSTKIGKDCMIGGQVGIVGHITIADGVKIAAQSGVGSSITAPGSIVQGSPAFDIGSYKRAYVGFRNLNKLEERVRQLEVLNTPHTPGQDDHDH
jgi:UDP-3-O-[3-hydroxymyristoyl] glucosamine N-acyltransferase